MQYRKHEIIHQSKDEYYVPYRQSLKFMGSSFCFAYSVTIFKYVYVVMHRPRRLTFIQAIAALGLQTDALIPPNNEEIEEKVILQPSEAVIDDYDGVDHIDDEGKIEVSIYSNNNIQCK